MGPLLKRLWRRARIFLGVFPFTPGGFLLGLVLLATVFYRGIRELDMVALAAGGALLFIQLIVTLVVGGGFFYFRRLLSRTEQPSFLELTSGKEVSTGYSVPYWSYVPLLRLGWTVEEFDARASTESHRGRLREILKCGRRGLSGELTRRFSVSDTLGLASLSWKQHSPGRVRVLPHPGRLDQPDILLSLVSGEDISDPRGDPTGDRVDMRQYQRGDPMKFILWKVYSRSGKVMVRVPERALAARPRACCFLLSGPHDEASAAIARVVIQYDMLGEQWRFGANGREHEAVRKDDALDLLALSGNETAPDCEHLQRFLIQAEQDGYGFCLVLAPPGSKSLADEVLGRLSRSGMNSEVWIGMDLESGLESNWLKVLQASREQAPEAQAVHSDWGGRATIIERNSGRVLARTRRPGR